MVVDVRLCGCVQYSMFIANWKPVVSQPQLQDWQDRAAEPEPKAKVQPLM